MDHANHYAQLEQGARYLARTACDEGKRLEHLSWANRYYRLRLDSLPAPMMESLQG